MKRNKPFLFIMTAVAAVQLLIVYFGGDIFRCIPISHNDLIKCAVFAATVIPFDLIRKSIIGLTTKEK